MCEKIFSELAKFSRAAFNSSFLQFFLFMRSYYDIVLDLSSF